MDGNKMMEVLSAHQQLKTYLPIIRDSPIYPVIYDSNRVVLSLPPIINGEHSKIKLETKDVFIESGWQRRFCFMMLVLPLQKRLPSSLFLSKPSMRGRNHLRDPVAQSDFPGMYSNRPHKGQHCAEHCGHHVRRATSKRKTVFFLSVTSVQSTPRPST